MSSDDPRNSTPDAVVDVSGGVKGMVDNLTGVVTDAADEVGDTAKAVVPAVLTEEDFQFDAIVKASKEERPFSSLTQGLGEGPASIAQKVDRTAVRDAAGAMSQVSVADLNVGFSLIALVIEIFRDFFQLMSLVFSFVFISPPEINFFFGRLCFLINLDITFLLPKASLPNAGSIFVGIWWGIFILSMLLMAYLNYIIKHVTPKPRREFIMCRTWAMLDTGAVRKVKIVTFLLTMLYLPVSQYALELLSCSYRYRTMFQECPNIWYMITSVIALAVITIILPVRLFILIRNNVPKRREFDVSGNVLEEYTIDMYKKDLAKVSRKNPLASLFNPYRRKMSSYKIVVMGLKLYLVLIAVLLSSNQWTGFENVEHYTAAPGPVSSNITAAPPRYLPETERPLYNHLRPVLVIVGLLVYTIATTVSKPFLNAMATIMDVTLRIISLLCVVFAYMMMNAVGVKALTVVIIVLMSIALLVSIIFFIASFDAVQEKVRVMRGDVVFTPASDQDDSPLWLHPRKVNFAAERKNRVWHGFWNNYLSYAQAYHPKDDIFDFEYVDTEDTTAYLLDFKGSVCERHHENREIAGDIGRTKYLQSLKPKTEKEVFDIIYATRMLHGRDCYVGDANSGAFGALYVIPFPFEAYHIADGSHKETVMGVEDVKELLATNLDSEIRRRRTLRESIRGLAANCNGDTYFFYQEQRTIRKQDGVTPQGKPKYRNVTVMVTFDRGQFSVSQDYETPVYQVPESSTEYQITPGFSAKLVYPKGTYTEEGGGEVGGKTITHAELGITPTFQDTEQLTRLLSGNKDKVENGRQRVLALKDNFRRFYMSEFNEKQKTLSYAFWAEVYSNDHISDKRLRRFLTEYEANPAIQRNATEDAFLQMAKVRLAYYDCCPAVRLWVCFWHDLFWQNLDMSFIAEEDDVKAVLNPWLPDSLIWNVMSEEKCNETLQGVKLQAEDGKGFIRAELIHALYKAMAKATKLEDDALTSSDAVVHLTPTTAGAGDDDDTSPEERYNEVARAPAYAQCLVPLFSQNWDDEGLRWMRDVAPNAGQDFYDVSMALPCDQVAAKTNGV